MLDRRTDINHARQRIGMVFQSFNLYPHMTALGNVMLALRKVAAKARAEAEDIGRAALARVGLADRPATIRANSPAVSSSASRSPVPSRSNRASCCSTSRPARLTLNWSAACSR